MPVDPDVALTLFNADLGRVLVLENGAKWFIKPFIEAMYKVPVEGLNPDNRVHASVISLLQKEGAYDTPISPLQGAKNKNKNKNENENKNMNKILGVGGPGEGDVFETDKFDRPEGKPDEPKFVELNTQAEHAWVLFLADMPKVNGKHLDLEACREYWARNPAKWNQWIAAVKNYAASERVLRGIGICNVMTFLNRVWLDWLQPEDKPLGEADGKQKNGTRDFGAERDAQRDRNIEQATARLRARAEGAETPSGAQPVDAQRRGVGNLAGGFIEGAAVEAVESG